jgi:hypothetical protein
MLEAGAHAVAAVAAAVVRDLEGQIVQETAGLEHDAGTRATKRPENNRSNRACSCGLRPREKETQQHRHQQNAAGIFRREREPCGDCGKIEPPRRCTPALQRASERRHGRSTELHQQRVRRDPARVVADLP